MPRRQYHLHDGKRGSALAIRVTPRASRNEIVAIQNDGTIKIHLTAPAHEGQANEQLLEFLSDILKVPKSRLEIVAGVNGRDKLVSILDMDVQEAHNRIVGHLR